MRKWIVLAVFLFPSLVWAQSAKFEVTPFGGYRWGGTITTYDTNLFGTDVDVKDSGAYGVLLGVPIGYNVQFELMADRQSTSLQTGHGLFEPNQNVADIDITYYHAGLLYQWDTATRGIQPFIVGSLGVADLNLHVPGVSNESRFSGSLGGGVKIAVNRNVGIRLEGRGFWTNTTDNNRDHCSFCNDYYSYNNDLYQGEVRVGLSLGF
ncbi:MAG: outer membrane beta-barrel protein [Thermoanaerobaculia bacterium]